MPHLCSLLNGKKTKPELSATILSAAHRAKEGTSHTDYRQWRNSAQHWANHTPNSCQNLFHAIAFPRPVSPKAPSSPGSFRIPISALLMTLRKMQLSPGIFLLSSTTPHCASSSSTDGAVEFGKLPLFCFVNMTLILAVVSQ